MIKVLTRELALLLGLLVCCCAQDDFCQTPKEERGFCINILNCPVLLDLLKTRRDPQAISFLQSSACGYEGKYPLVCCPDQVSQGNTKTFEEQQTPAPVQPPVQEPPKPKRYSLPKAPECGYSNITNGRIVGGVPAKLGEFPWIVALGYRNSDNPNLPKWLCGGTLITEKHVITAGHCVNNRPDLYLARLGELDLYSNDDGANPIDVPIEKTKIHESYSASSFTNDIALLTLSKTVGGPMIRPVCLPIDEPYRSRDFVRYYPFVAGWGALYFNGPTSSRLQVLMIPVVTNDQCRSAFTAFKNTVIDDRVLCAGYLRGGKDACQGDSGGPLMWAKVDDDHFSFYLIGVVSYGFRCAEAGYPGVYTRVTAFIDWIEQNLN